VGFIVTMHFSKGELNLKSFVKNVPDSIGLNNTSFNEPYYIYSCDSKTFLSLASTKAVKAISPSLLSLMYPARA
jgi:hypothetical protein